MTTARQTEPGAATGPAFEFLNGWADRIFVVSLRRAVERRARISERLAGLRFEFLDAVDKKDLDRERLVRDGAYDESRTRRAYRHRHDMTLGAIGCALSHRRLYEDMVTSGWDRMVAPHPSCECSGRRPIRSGAPAPGRTAAAVPSRR